MRGVRMFRLRLRSLFSRRRIEEELEEELRFHLECQVEKNIGAGMTPENARYAALRSMADIEQRKEECRDVRGTRWLENFVSDLRYAFRQFRKHKSFSAVTAVILALGIGATTAVYSVAQAVIFAPLPFPKPDRLVHIFEGSVGARYQPGGENILSTVRNAIFQDWREQARCFESMTAVRRTQAIL